MNDELSNEPADTDEERSLLCRRLFLQSMGKWSGAAIAAAVFGSAWLAAPPEANAGAWVNRRGGGGGGWINGGGGGGGDGSTAVAMAAEGHGSIVGRRFTGIQLRGAENQLVTTNSRSFSPAFSMSGSSALGPLGCEPLMVLENIERIHY